MSLAPGDLGDLVPALEPLQRPAWHSMSAPELRAELASRGKCSALVKVTGGYDQWHIHYTHVNSLSGKR